MIYKNKSRTFTPLIIMSFQIFTVLLTFDQYSTIVNISITSLNGNKEFLKLLSDLWHGNYFNGVKKQNSTLGDGNHSQNVVSAKYYLRRNDVLPRS